MITLSGPLRVSLEITNYCTLECRFCCNVFSHKPTNLLKSGDWKTILSKLKPYAVELRVTGGEPTLHPDFFEIIKLIDSAGFTFHVFTNGLWDNTDLFLKRLGAFTHFSHLLISLHAIDKRGYAHISPQMGNRQFERLLLNIKRASQHFPVNTNTVLTKKNRGVLKGILDLTRSLGVQSCTFARYIGKPIEDIYLTARELRECLSRLKVLKEKGYPVCSGTCTPMCFQPYLPSGCEAARSYCVIDPSGNLRPCSHSRIVAGSLINYDISSLWKSREMRLFRKRFPPSCKKCTFKNVCPGGCKAMAELLEVDCDPLIGEPPQTEEKNSPLKLLENHILTLDFTERIENFGYILIKGSEYFPLTKGDWSIVQQIRHNPTVGEFIDSCPQGIELLRNLIETGFVGLRKPDYSL